MRARPAECFIRPRSTLCRPPQRRHDDPVAARVLAESAAVSGQTPFSRRPFGTTVALGKESLSSSGPSGDPPDAADRASAGRGSTVGIAGVVTSW